MCVPASLPRGRTACQNSTQPLRNCSFPSSSKLSNFKLNEAAAEFPGCCIVELQDPETLPGSWQLSFVRIFTLLVAMPSENFFSSTYLMGYYFSWKRLTHSRFAANISSCLDEALASHKGRVKVVDRDAGWILGMQCWWRRSSVVPFYTSKEKITDLSEMLKKDCSDHQMHVSWLWQGYNGACKVWRERRHHPWAAIPPWGWFVLLKCWSLMRYV